MDGIRGRRQGSVGFEPRPRNRRLAVQTVQTHFGDAMPPGNVDGSELDAAYGVIRGGRLYLMFTGNQQLNFNTLDIFIDSRSGGENVLSSTPDYHFNPGGGWITSNLGGLTFDNTSGPDGSPIDFEADFHLISRWGSSLGPYETDFVDRQGGTNSMVPGNAAASPNAVGLTAVGTISPADLGPNASGSALSQNLKFAINDNNAAGVMGGTGASDQVAAVAVTTSMEFSIALADIGSPDIGSTIYISGMINNGDHNFLSNQVLGGLPPGTGSLGGDGAGTFTGNLAGVNFNQFPGLQHFGVLVVLEPSSAVLAGLALICLIGIAAFRKQAPSS